MRVRQPLLGCAAALVVSMSASYASPCSQEIDRQQAELDLMFARESTAATLHRQPTPESIAAAESKLEVSPEKLQALAAAMARAREADRAGDPIACEQALADAQRARGQ